MNTTDKYIKSKSIAKAPKNPYFFIDEKADFNGNVQRSKSLPNMSADSRYFWIVCDCDEIVLDEIMSQIATKFAIVHEYDSTSKKDNIERACFSLTPLS
tara:strand:- start:5 stop:301 length:297 start_codon:yes stop_codon:yes gene_type:complete